MKICGAQPVQVPKDAWFKVFAAQPATLWLRWSMLFSEALKLTVRKLRDTMLLETS